MSSNSFGRLFRCTTWGESHGKCIGVVIDGCPAGIEISLEEIQSELNLRAPGQSPYTSPRYEKDRVEILSGIFEGKSTGAPISLMINNGDVDSSKYEPIKDLLRPGHANYTYLEKYGVFDWRGGGRASARETACRVAAGAVAKILLKTSNINVHAWISSIGSESVQSKDFLDSPNIVSLLEKIKAEGDSIGGCVSFSVEGLPVGLGDPVYEKLEANLAKAMMGIPATKGFEIGEGFKAARLKGSEHNDQFGTKSNHAGGVLGGISTGLPIQGTVAFKPTSSIAKVQQTLTTEGEKAEFKLPEGSRHDPCVAIRAVPVVEAMAAIVIADALLINRTAKAHEYV